jgi:uncharacterized membrane protein YagU involved in acid resistance
MHFRSRSNRLYKDLIAGAVGGLAGSWVMTQFQSLFARAVQGKTDPHQGEGEDATVKTAEKISSAVLRHPLSDDEKKKAGPIVHYTYGTAIGALYGGLAHRNERAEAGFGSACGAVAWALGDEVAVPALGLGKKPAETPLSQHVQTLAAHVVYGMTLEGVRRLTAKVLSANGRA